MADEAGAGPPGRGMRSRDWTPREARTVLVRRLRARRAEIDEAIFARVRDLAPGVVALDDPEYVAGLRAAVVAAVDYVLEGLEHEGGFSPRIPSAAVAQARRAARAGVGLDTLLRRYIAGHAILEDFVMQEADHGEKDGLPPTQRIELRRVLETSASLLDRLIPLIASTYMRELEQAGSPPARRGRPPALARPGKQSDGAGGGSPRTHEDVVRGQRARTSRRGRTSRRDRILEAMVEVAAERGFAGVSVKLLTGRAGVSTRTFYAEFEGLQDCFVAALDLALERAGGLIVQAFVREDRWEDGVLGALASLLVFFDSEPALTRVWFVEAMAAGSWALERREHIAEMLRSMIVGHWVAHGDEAPDPVAAAGVMASVLGLIQTHLVTERPEPLIELLGPLMGLVTSLYLDKQDVAREVQRGVQVTRDIQAGDSRWSLPSVQAAGQDTEQGVALPATLANPSARRARECLIFLVEQDPQGSGPSNREIAAGIGVTQQSQISRLLSSLVGENLVTKRSEGAGKRNEWRLTPRGEEIARALSEQGG